MRIMDRKKKPDINQLVFPKSASKNTHPKASTRMQQEKMD